MRWALIAITSLGVGYLWGRLQPLFCRVAYERRKRDEWERAAREADRQNSAGGRRVYRNLSGRLMGVGRLQANDFTSLQTADAVARDAASSVPGVIRGTSIPLGALLWCFTGQGLDELVAFAILSIIGTIIAQMDLRRLHDPWAVKPAFVPHIWLPIGAACVISLCALLSSVGMQPPLLLLASILFAAFLVGDVIWYIKCRLWRRDYGP